MYTKIITSTITGTGELANWNNYPVLYILYYKQKSSSVCVYVSVSQFTLSRIGTETGEEKYSLPLQLGKKNILPQLRSQLMIRENDIHTRRGWESQCFLPPWDVPRAAPSGHPSGGENTDSSALFWYVLHILHSNWCWMN